MTSPWYYEYHKNGLFSHQQRLCDVLRWTRYNLEGQELKEANSLSAIQANPLTIRLLALDDALCYFNNVKAIDQKIKQIAKEQFAKKSFFNMHGTWIAEESSLNTKGAPIQIIETAGERFELRHVDIHLALYGFFTNFSSILDRLAYEIDKFHDLGTPKSSLDWGKLTSQSRMDTLRTKHGVLADLLAKYHKDFYTAIRYRNRLTHDGTIRIEVDVHYSGVNVKLAENCDVDASPMNVDAMSFCESKREEIIALIDNSYRLMLQYHKNRRS